MKRIIFLFLAGSCGLLRVQASSPAPGYSEQEVGIHSDHFYYDGKARELVYYDNVVATNAQGQLTCGRLTILLPPESSLSGHPTNVVAETNVVIDFLRNGDTNHISSDKAIYAYSVVNAITNETITFTGHARGENAKGWMTGEPLVWDNIANKFTGTDFKTMLKPAAKSGNGTNASGMDTNFPPGKLDLVPERHSDNQPPQPN
jgi:lipopolysaccharide export system protein LptA